MSYAVVAPPQAVVAGSVGSYAFLSKKTNTGTNNFGEITFGALLYPVCIGRYPASGNAAYVADTAQPMKGMWRCLGISDVQTLNTGAGAGTLWVRVS